MLGILLAQSANEVPGFTPDPQALPGGSTANEFVSGIIFFSLIFIVVGIVLSAGLWAVGAFSNNYTQSVNGKRGFLICAGAALAVGAVTVLVNFFYNAGQGVDQSGV